VSDREAFVEALRRFAARIDEREARLLGMLTAGPRTLAELVRERLLYPPGHDELWIASAEARSIEQHLAELVAAGRVVARDASRYGLARS